MHSERAVSWVTQPYLLVLPLNLVCLVERFRWNSPEMSRCFFPENPYNQSQKTTEHFWSGMIHLWLLRRSTDMMQSGGLPSHPHLCVRRQIYRILAGQINHLIYWLQKTMVIKGEGGYVCWGRRTLNEFLKLTVGAISSSGAARVKNLSTSLIVKWNHERYSRADVDKIPLRKNMLI